MGSIKPGACQIIIVTSKDTPENAAILFGAIIGVGVRLNKLIRSAI